MNVYKIRVTGAVLETSNATRRVNVNGQVLTFGREPVYIRAAELPSELADDPCLRIEEVQFAPPGAEVIKLKAERVQEPEAVVASPPPASPGKKRG
jgi:hypothetical protein